MDTAQAYVWRLQNFVLVEHILRPCPENPMPVKVWDFKGRELKSRWEVGCPVAKIVYHRHNGLLATVADDLVIRLFDVAALRLVRKFEGHTDRITDLCFSEDGKWVLSSSMDGSLRIWDVILARQIDALHVDIAITALSLSPNMDILATTHVDQNGVYIWVNKSMYSGPSNVDSFASGKQVVDVKLPSISYMDDGSEDSDEHAVDNSSVAKVVASLPNNKQTPGLVTLSLLPKSQWQSLINLDVIKVSSLALIEYIIDRRIIILQSFIQNCKVYYPYIFYFIL